MKHTGDTRSLSVLSTLVLASLAIAGLLSGCGAATPSSGGTLAATPTAGGTATTSTSEAGIGFEPAPWQNGSRASYDWLNSSGTQVGTSQFSFELSGNTWTISETDHISELEQTIEMRIDAATLAPLGEQKTIHTASNDVQITTQYADGKLTVDAVVNGQTRSASIEVPANAIDNEQSLMTFRALPFAQGYQASYVIIVASNALKVDTTIDVLSQESVTVPAGTFDAWRVEFTAGQNKQYAWYQVAAPHALIQYDNGTNRMVLSGD
jgi:hypothetical protein